MERSSNRALKTSLSTSERKGNPHTKKDKPPTGESRCWGRGTGCWAGWEGRGSGHRFFPHYSIVQSGHSCLLDVCPRDSSLERIRFSWKQTPRRAELRPVPRSLGTSRGLQGAVGINLGAVTTPPHVGSSFLPLPSEHFRQADLLSFLLSEIKKCSLALLPFENIKITQERSYFQRAEATLARKECKKLTGPFFFFF